MYCNICRFLSGILIVSLLFGSSSSASADDLFWDANGATDGTGGTGVWDTGSSLWRNGSAAGALQTWTNTPINTDTAVLGGTAGTLTLNSSSIDINVNRILHTTSGFVINGPAAGTAKLNFSGVNPEVRSTGSVSLAINAAITGSSGLSFINPNDLTNQIIFLNGDISGLTGTIDIGVGGSATSSTRLFLGSSTSAVNNFTGGANNTFVLGSGVNGSTPATLAYVWQTNVAGPITNIVRLGNLTSTATTSVVREAGNPNDGNVNPPANDTSNPNKITTWEIGELNQDGLYAGLFLYSGGQNRAGSAINKVGTGKLTLSNANSDFGSRTSGSAIGSLFVAGSYTNVTVSDGTLSVGSIVVASGRSALGNSTSAVVLGGSTTEGTLEYTGAAANYSRGFTVNAGGGVFKHDGTGTVTMSGSGISIATGGAFTVLNTNGQATIINSNITGNGGLIVDTAGVITVGGTNAYAGATSVKNGTLLVNGTHTGGGLYTVDAGATLGGTGSIGADVDVLGFLAPGASIESLDILGNVSFGSLSQLNIEIDENDAGIIDLLVITGDLSILSGAMVNFAVTGPLTLSEYVFGTYTGDLTGSFGSLSTPIGYELQQGGGQLKLVAAVIPEPSSALLLLLGVAAVFKRNRKR